MWTDATQKFEGFFVQKEQPILLLIVFVGLQRIRHQAVRLSSGEQQSHCEAARS